VADDLRANYGGFAYDSGLRQPSKAFARNLQAAAGVEPVGLPMISSGVHGN